MKLSNLDYEGMGVFEYAGLGQLPFQLPTPATLMTVVGGLQTVKTEYTFTAIQFFNATNLSKESETPDTIKGQAYVSQVIGSGWASDHISKGYVVMANMASLSTAAPEVLITKNAGLVAQSARVGAPYIVIDGDAQVLASARAQLKKPVQPVQPVIPPVVPPGPTPPVPARLRAQPTWLVPVLAVAGGVAILALAAAVQKQGRRR